MWDSKLYHFTFACGYAKMTIQDAVSLPTFIIITLTGVHYNERPSFAGKVGPSWE